MKLYILNKEELFHFCEGRKRADSLFCENKDYFSCTLCDIKIPKYITFAFISKKKTYTTFSKTGFIRNYSLEELLSLNPDVINI